MLAFRNSATRMVRSLGDRPGREHPRRSDAGGEIFAEIERIAVNGGGLMKRTGTMAEAEPMIRRLCSDWAEQNNIPMMAESNPSFSNFYSWLESNTRSI